MKIGVTFNFGAYGARVPQMAALMEELGFESMWTGEHIFVPVDIADPVRHGAPLPEMYKHMPDLFVVLAAAAAVTSRIKLATNICIVPQRHPLVLAKEIATLDVISEGRVILGAGVGWIEEEAQILGYPFKRRTAIHNEYLRAMKALWTGEQPSFAGEFVSFPPVHSNPKPVQKPHPPILVGAGNANTDNTRVLRRVAESADGWLPIFLSPEQTREQLGELRQFCTEAGRSFDELDITMIVPCEALGIDENAWKAGSSDRGRAREVVAAYEDAGATRLAILPWNAMSTGLFGEDQFRFLAESLPLSG